MIKVISSILNYKVLWFKLIKKNQRRSPLNIKITTLSRYEDSLQRRSMRWRRRWFQDIEKEEQTRKQRQHKVRHKLKNVKKKLKREKEWKKIRDSMPLRGWIDKLDKYLIFKLINLPYLYLFHVFCVYFLEGSLVLCVCLVMSFFFNFLRSLYRKLYRKMEDYKVIS